ncbi:peptidoglycan-binding domain-containing protein [Embleya sp. AB8]|uniref:peptidoglycan-binding domain-containing protein n=1 Tax=Embleya sp. AB8 TaxID=3156304 RepID=UPI003C7643A8
MRFTRRALSAGVTAGAVAAVLAIATPAQANPGVPNLSYGDSGVGVHCVQRILAHVGYHPGALDGIWGDKTETAVERFQANHHLGVDGIVGPNTGDALFNAWDPNDDACWSTVPTH